MLSSSSSRQLQSSSSEIARRCCCCRHASASSIPDQQRLRHSQWSSSEIARCHRCRRPIADRQRRRHCCRSQWSLSEMTIALHRLCCRRASTQWSSVMTITLRRWQWSSAMAIALRCLHPWRASNRNAKLDFL